MLFIVDSTVSPSSVSDGSYKVKRICLESNIIEAFCAQCPSSSPTKVLMMFAFDYAVLLLPCDYLYMCDYVV
jgi:hypothetical protein